MAFPAAECVMLATTLFIGLVAFVWLRLLAIFLLVLVDHVLRRRAPPDAREIPLADVTIVIPAYQEVRDIGKTLACARDAVEAGAALVVVDDGSSDRTAEIVREQLDALGRGRLIRHPRNLGKAAALNTGIDAVATRFLLTLDADTIVSRKAIEIAVDVLERDDVSAQRYAAVAFDVSVEPSTSLFAELQATEYDASLNFERRGQAVVQAVSVAPGAASLWRASDLRQIGGFSSATVTEDVDATLRLAARGRRAAHVAGAQAFTRTPATFAHLMAQRRRWCLGHYQGIVRAARDLGGDAVFTTLTYPNFLLLSAFMPLMCVLSLAALFVKAGAWIVALGWLTLIWLATVYLQRFVALRLIGTRVRLAAFLLEPFSTQLFHFCAMMLIVYGLVRGDLAERSSAWASRAR
jgi:cellulose synthase/poly-beta-1,6-N-acetylglucosamine synthase-like glycosyltransferase